MNSKQTERMNDRRDCVCVRDFYFSYNDSNPILKGINLTVGKGVIYGLLGSSGCGKT